MSVERRVRGLEAILKTDDMTKYENRLRAMSNHEFLQEILRVCPEIEADPEFKTKLAPFLEEKDGGWRGGSYVFEILDTVFGKYFTPGPDSLVTHDQH